MAKIAILLLLITLLATVQNESAHISTSFYRELQQIAEQRIEVERLDGQHVVEFTPSVFFFDNRYTLKHQAPVQTEEQIPKVLPKKPQADVKQKAEVKKEDKTKTSEPQKQATPNNDLNKERIIAGISTKHSQYWKKFIELSGKGLSSPDAQEEKKYYESKYDISQYEELPICVFIPSFKNVAKNRYLFNIRSILQQDYSNYRILFVDDMSEDGTGEAIQKYVKDHQISQQKITIRINTERKMAMRNIHWAVNNFCKPYEIFIIVDGDDELLGKQVFKFFNAIYQKQDLWILYTNFITAKGSVGYSRPYADRVRKASGYRKAGFMISHLRSFYTKLMTLIDEEDLKDPSGEWYHAANDVAMYIPMLEMCGMKANYMPELNYIYNANTGLNNHRVRLSEQKGNDRAIRKKKPYTVLQNLFTEEQLKELKKNTGKKIPIKDLSLPKPDPAPKQLEGWEMD